MIPLFQGEGKDINARVMEENKGSWAVFLLPAGLVISIFVPPLAGYTIPQTAALIATGAGVGLAHNAGRQLIEMGFYDRQHFDAGELAFGGVSGASLSFLAPAASRVPYLVIPAGNLVGGLSLYNESQKGRLGVGLYDLGFSGAPYLSKTVRIGVSGGLISRRLLLSALLRLDL